VLIATPREFFEQSIFESEYENHVSHWTVSDFKRLGFVEYQNYEAGAVYLLSDKPIDIRGFGNSLKKRIRRLARMLKAEF
jgi:hypothetical protein